uniref:Wzy n=1 Tax=Escherichia coli TaxID=562 RepID=D8WNA6_ECOLX|nr:Wzy [Escherichia coli]
MLTYSVVNWKAKLLYFILFLSFLNAVLRLSEDGLSIYRLFIPLQIFLIYTLSVTEFKKFIVILLLLLLFGATGCMISTYSLNENNLVFLIHYSILILTFFSSSVLISITGETCFYKFTAFFFGFLIVTGIMDLFGVTFPNIEHIPDAIRGIHRIENDYSLALVSFVFVVFSISRKKITASILTFFTSAICFYNDSKVALLFVVAGYFCFIFKNIRFRQKGIQVDIIFFFVIMLIMFLFNYIFSYKIAFPGRDIHIRTNRRACYQIIELNPYGDLYGSISNRTDMVIYTLKDLFSSFGLGIGFGNTLTMLSTAKYAFIGSAKSIHNFPLQFIAGIGLIFSLFLLYSILKQTSLYTKIIFFLMLLASLSQSVGVFSNYYFFCCLFFIILHGKQNGRV